MNELEHKTYDSERGSVHYWTTGQSEQCIFFAHGATMDHGLFEHQVAYFSRHYKVILWDAPAHGRSRPYQGFSLNQSASDLIHILELENIDQAHLVGQSMGGYIAQLAANAYPGRAKSLTVIGCSSIQREYHRSLDFYVAAITPDLIHLYSYTVLASIIANQVGFSIVSRKYAFETLSNYSKAEIKHIMGSLYTNVKNFEPGSKLRLPQLITYGGNDRIGTIKPDSDEWAKRENLPLRVISKASHNCNMDNPNEFNGVLAEFLGTL